MKTRSQRQADHDVLMAPLVAILEEASNLAIRRLPASLPAARRHAAQLRALAEDAAKLAASAAIILEHDR